jgi:hypothetical protein
MIFALIIFVFIVIIFVFIVIVIDIVIVIIVAVVVSLSSNRQSRTSTRTYPLHRPSPPDRELNEKNYNMPIAIPISPSFSLSLKREGWRRNKCRSRGIISIPNPPPLTRLHRIASLTSLAGISSAVPVVSFFPCPTRARARHRPAISARDLTCTFDG